MFGKVDTEAEPGLAAAFEIRAIPTLVAFRDGILHAVPIAFAWNFVGTGSVLSVSSQVPPFASDHNGHRVAGDERHADHAVHHLDEAGV